MFDFQNDAACSKVSLGDRNLSPPGMRCSIVPRVSSVSFPRAAYQHGRVDRPVAARSRQGDDLARRLLRGLRQRGFGRTGRIKSFR